MQVSCFHPWNVSPREAIEIQQQLRNRVILQGHLNDVRFIAGVDVAFTKHSNGAYAALAVLRFPDLEPVEILSESSTPSFPYIPGLLSFREIPAILPLFEKVRHVPDLIFVDGHGYSHPRRAGLACHLGVVLDRPVMGCAKTRLIGRYHQPDIRRGSVAYLYDGDREVIGAVVRTRDHVQPVFVSAGHKLDLETAVTWTLASTKGFRLPEPTRQADQIAGWAKRGREISAVAYNDPSRHNKRARRGHG